MALQLTDQLSKKIELDFYDLLRKELNNNMSSCCKAIFPHQLHNISTKLVKMLDKNLDIK